MELQISSNCAEGTCTLGVEGEIDVANATTFREALMGLIEDSHEGIIVDLSKVPYIDSTGIGVLMGAAHRAEELGLQVRVVCPHDGILRVLTMLGLDKQLHITKEL